MVVAVLNTNSSLGCVDRHLDPLICDLQAQRPDLPSSMIKQISFLSRIINILPVPPTSPYDHV